MVPPGGPHDPPERLQPVLAVSAVEGPVEEPSRSQHSRLPRPRALDRRRARPRARALRRLLLCRRARHVRRLRRIARRCGPSRRANPCHDPTVLIPVLAREVPHLGFASTYSTSYFPPYHTAKLFSTLSARR